MSYRVKGDRPLTRSDIIDIILAANAAHYKLAHDCIAIGEKGKHSEALPLTPQNFLNELYGRLQSRWFDPDPIEETQRMRSQP